MLERAFGPEVMKAIASVKASDVAGAAQEGSAHATDASRSALNALIGNETTGGALQVTTTGAGKGGDRLLALVSLRVSLRPRVSCHAERCRFRLKESRCSTDEAYRGSTGRESEDPHA